MAYTMQTVGPSGLTASLALTLLNQTQSFLASASQKGWIWGKTYERKEKITASETLILAFIPAPIRGLSKEVMVVAKCPLPCHIWLC